MTPVAILSAEDLKEGPRPSDLDARREAAIRVLLANGLAHNVLGIVMSPVDMAIAIAKKGRRP